MKPYKNVYSAEEYKQLQELNEAALEQNKILKRQLDEAMNKQKVELPRKVVEAIEGFRELGWEPHDIFQVSYDPTDGQWSSELNKYISIKSNGARKLMEALVNGYTVEKTPEDRVIEMFMHYKNQKAFLPMEAMEEMADALGNSHLSNRLRELRMNE
ncbi:DUF1642 domain-containing protein [Paenibacillus sp. FSL R5-0810]|uniref:DUF1642 domain-containing protein n=1 Tax=Paenibacillus sp. FSL R5-0810 TaxID=2921659 RepID=UPI0030F95A93